MMCDDASASASQGEFHALCILPAIDIYRANLASTGAMLHARALHAPILALNMYVLTWVLKMQCLCVHPSFTIIIFETKI